jgi:hypothetical protein
MLVRIAVGQRVGVMDVLAINWPLSSANSKVCLKCGRRAIEIQAFLANGRRCKFNFNRCEDNALYLFTKKKNSEGAGLD